MLPIFFGIAAFDSVHFPSPLVVHDPARPLLQEPLTVAPASGVWPPSWMVTVTTAVQAVCWLAPTRSRSPTCIVLTTVTGLLCAFVPAELSETVSVTL